MTKEEVHEVMGTKSAGPYNNPYRTAMQYDENNEPIEVFYYWTDGSYVGGITDNELTPVVFQNGKVIGWGREFFTEFVQKYEFRFR